MTLFSELLGIKVLTLASSEGSVGIPATTGSPGFEGNRVRPEELEAAYFYDPLVLNSINKRKQLIMAAGFQLRGDDKSVKFFNEFFSQIGKVGEEMTLEEIFDIIYKNLYIYGKHFIEIVYNEKMSKALDLYSPDPKTIYYARDTNKRVVLDLYGRPMGYAKTIPYGMMGVGDEPPTTVVLQSGQIFLKPERLAHFKLNTFGDRFSSVGLIEPAYKSIFRKHKIDEAQANLIFTRGSAPIIDYVGSPEHWPTPDIIKQATENLAKMQHNRALALPFWHKIETLEVKPADIVGDVLKSFKEDISSSLGMPLALATGSGEDTNRSTLATQLKFLEFSLKDDVRTVINVFERQIIRRIATMAKVKPVQIIWGDIDSEDKTSKASRLVNYAKVGILAPEEAKNYALESERLDIKPSKK